MKISALSSIAIALLGAVTTRAVPFKRSSYLNDTVLLNAALTAEHLEVAFYTLGLSQFNSSDFTAANFSVDVYGRFQEILTNEQTHVELLEEALGSNAVQPCNYTFPFDDPVSFAALSQIFEGVGVTLYAGLEPLLSSSTYRTIAAVILSTEARQAAFVASFVNGVNPWSGAFDVSLNTDQVFTLASPFIVSCPSSNPVLPIQPFPQLNITTTSLEPGSNATIAYANSSSVTVQTYVAFLTGLTQIFVPVYNGQVTLPELFGAVYAIVTTNDTTVTDSNTLAGPALLQFDFNAEGQLINN